MTFVVDTNKVDVSYDHLFENSAALPWLPWVGIEFKYAKNKTLMLGESTYIWEAENKLGDLRIQEEIRIRERVSKNDHLRILHQNHALDFNRPSKYVRNIERAIFQSKSPSNTDKERLWASVIYHNLVLRPMPTLKDRPSYEDYKAGWNEMLNMASHLAIEQCVVYGLERKKINALLAILKLKNEGGELAFKRKKLAGKIGRLTPCTITIEKNGQQLKILFMRHPSAYFD